MLLRLVALCLPLAVWAASPCLPTKTTLHCQNIALERLPEFYNGELLLRLENVTGNAAWNVTGFEAVNTVIGTKMNVSQDALASLMKLPHLSTLEFTDSAVEIKDASNIFTNENLRYLRLIASLINGVDFFNFTYLHELDLSGNKLVTIPKIHGDKIVYLNLSSTSIRRVQNLENLTSLEELDLSNNGLRLVEKNAFSGNAMLDKLWLQNNNLRNITFNASALHILNLNYNDLQTIKGEFFSGVPKVTNLNLVGNKILDMIEPFKYLPLLKVVDLYDNDLSVLNGSWFEHTPDLEVLKIGHNNLLELPQLNASLHSLHHLNLSHNALQALNSEFFKNTPTLAVLDVTRNQLKSIDAATPYLRSLNKLYAAHNYLQITEQTFAKMEMLNFLNVSHNAVNIKAGIFDKAYALRDIDLSYNDVDNFCDGKPPLHIQNLDIRFNKMTSLKCLTGLDSLDVEGNPLKCDLATPPVSKNMTHLRILNSPDDVVLGNSSTPAPDALLTQSDNGDWQEVYKKICPTSVVVKITTTPEPPIIHDIADKSLPNDDSYDADGDSDEDDSDEDDDDDDYVNIEEVQSAKKSIVSLDEQMKNLHQSEPLASWAFALLGVCLLLLLINLLMFVWYRRRERLDAHLGSDRPYEQLHNEVYKNTTTRVESAQRPADIRHYFSALKKDKLNHIVVKLGLRNESNDTESQARMISDDHSINQIA